MFAKSSTTGAEQTSEERNSTWHPFLAPSQKILAQLVQGEIDHPEFRRRYWLELESLRPYCELLRIQATFAGLWVSSGENAFEQAAAEALVQYIERLECQRRWRLGWIVGGYTYPLRRQIRNKGGLWFDQHKAWVFPDYHSWHAIQTLLPADF